MLQKLERSQVHGGCLKLQMRLTPRLTSHTFTVELASCPFDFQPLHGATADLGGTTILALISYAGGGKLHQCLAGGSTTSPGMAAFHFEPLTLECGMPWRCVFSVLFNVIKMFSLVFEGSVINALCCSSPLS